MARAVTEAREATPVASCSRRCTKTLQEGRTALSTQIATLQPNTRAAQPMWPVASLALLVVAIVAVIVTASDGPRPADETTSAGTAPSIVGAPVSTGVPATHGKQLGREV